MGYRGGHYYNFGRQYACIYYSSMWFPEGNDNFKTIILNNQINVSGGFVMERIDGSNPVYGGPGIHDRLYFYAYNQLIGVVTRYTSNPNAFAGIINGAYESDYVAGSYVGPNPNGDPTSSYYRITISSDVKKVRNDVSNAYFSLFGRYGEQAGVEGYTNSWLYGTGRQSYGTITNLVRAGGDRNVGGSGEWNDVQSFGRHTGMSPGTCPIVGCTDPAASNYNRNATRDDGSCTYPAPSVSITANPTSLIRGSSATISWSITNATSASISGIGTVSTSSSGSTTVTPSSTTTYTLTASGRGGTTSRSITVTVYIPPQISLTADRTQIVRGESTVLRWATTGDANRMTISPGFGDTLLSSNSQISPTVTTTYTATATGLGGTDTKQITIVVIQPPSVDLNGPLTVNYGNTATLSYQQQNSTTSLTIQKYYYYLDGQVVVQQSSLPVGESSSGTFVDSIPYTNKGPSSITYNLVGVRDTLTDTDSISVSVNIDQNPNLIDVPESIDKLKNEEPVITPESTALMELRVEDIDIPVEIKSSVPLQVSFDNDDVYRDIRSL